MGFAKSRTLSDDVRLFAFCLSRRCAASDRIGTA